MSRRAWLVITTWALVVVAVLGGGLALGGQFDETFTITGTESQEALDTLDALFPEVSGASAQAVSSLVSICTVGWLMPNSCSSARASFRKASSIVVSSGGANGRAPNGWASATAISSVITVPSFRVISTEPPKAFSAMSSEW